jgi:hypothetical protein
VDRNRGPVGRPPWRRLHSTLSATAFSGVSFVFPMSGPGSAARYAGCALSGTRGGSLFAGRFFSSPRFRA